MRSKRIGDKVKQLTLLNLGRHFDVDQIHWPELCTRIEELLSGQAALIPMELPHDVERHAQRITAQIVARQPAEERDAAPASDVQSVDVNSMNLVRPRSVGVEQAALWAMSQVNFHELLKGQDFTTPQRAAAVGGMVKDVQMPSAESSRALSPCYSPTALLKLSHKQPVVAHEASWLFRITPYIVFSATVLAVATVPLIAVHLPTSAIADAIVLVGLFAFARFFQALAAMDIGTAFGGMGLLAR